MLRANALAVLSLLAFACGSSTAPKPPLTPPAAPATLTATANGTSIALSWSASDTATGYIVLRGTVAGGPYTSIGTPSATSSTDSGLANGTTYHYVVQATNAAGASGNSAEASATTGAAAPVAPVAPASLTATGGKGQITLAWTASPGATSYKISRGAAAGAHAALATVATNSYTDAAAPAGATSYYVVVASNPAGDSPPSSEASALTAPPPPTALTASLWTQTGLTLSWTASPGAATYAVARGTAPGGEGAPGPSTAGTSLADSSLSPGTSYFYVVTATNASGTSDASPELSTVTVPGNPALTAAPGDGFVALGWPAVQGATLYDVFQSASSGGTYNGIGSTAKVTFNVTVPNGTTAYFRIDAHNASGTSGLSNPASATPSAGLPNAPVLTAAVAGNGQVTLSWTASATGAAATGFKVYRSTTPGIYGGALAAPTASPYIDMTAANGTKYDYVVRATNGVGDGPASNELSATPVAPLAAPVVTAVGLNGAIRLTWPAVARATGYNVYKASVPGGPYGAPLAQPTAATYSDIVANRSGLFYYVVRATTATETSPASNEASASAARELCVATDGPAILAFDADASGQTDARRFFGNATRLLNPPAIAVDTGRQEIAAANPAENSITFHSTAASGNAPPVRLLAGDKTQLSNPRSLGLDLMTNRLVVANDLTTTAGLVTVFDRAADGDVAPLSSFTTFSRAKDLLVDAKHAQVFVSDGSALSIYPEGATGSPTPATLTPTTSAAESIQALALDPARDELYVAVKSTRNTIRIYDRAATDLTTTVPKREINAAGFPPVSSLLFDPVSSEIVVSSGGTLYAYNPTQSSTTIQPTRTLPTAYGSARLAYDSAGSGFYRFATDYSALAVIARDGSSVAGDRIGARIDPNSDVPTWLVADVGRDELWMDSKSTSPFVGVFARTASVLNDLPLRQWGGNVSSADYAGIAVNPTDNEVYVVSYSGQSVTTFSSTAATDRSAGHLGSVLVLPPADFPGNIFWDGKNGELILSLSDSQGTVFGIAFYKRTGPGAFAARRLTITGPTTRLNGPTTVISDGSSVFALNADASVVRLASAGTGTLDEAPLAFLTQAVPSLSPYFLGTGMVLDNQNLYLANDRTSVRFQVSVYPVASFNGTIPVAPARALEVRGAGPHAQGLAFCN